MKGKFIAIYGINGIGKSTQMELIQKEITKMGMKVKYLKYPVYDLEPEGPFLYKYLRDESFREKNELSTHELQEKFTRNRERYEKTLRKELESDTWIIAEDYVGTGIVWGMTWGGSYSYLKEINKNLLKPDVEILMDGEQFDTAIEKGHKNEDDKERILICRNFLQMLAEIQGWSVVDAHQSREKVTGDIMQAIDI